MPTADRTTRELAADLRDRLQLCAAAGDLGTTATDLPLLADELAERLERPPRKPMKKPTRVRPTGTPTRRQSRD